jgi:hypothetical protein
MDYFLDDYYKLDCKNKINYLAILNGTIVITDSSTTQITDTGTINGYNNGNVSVILTGKNSSALPYFPTDLTQQTYRASYSIPITNEVTKILISDTKAV